MASEDLKDSENAKVAKQAIDECQKARSNSQRGHQPLCLLRRNQFRLRRRELCVPVYFGGTHLYDVSKCTYMGSGGEIF